MNNENLQNQKQSICKTLAQTKMTVLKGILNQQDGMARTGLIWFRKYGNEYGNEPADSTRSLLHSVFINKMLQCTCLVYHSKSCVMQAKERNLTLSMHVPQPCSQEPKSRFFLYFPAACGKIQAETWNNQLPLFITNQFIINAIA